jgi:polysaccharide export outer membrane protein
MLFSTLSRAFVTIGLVGSLTVSLTGQETEYLLGPQDVLSITVWGQGGVSERFTVEVDGTFIFPLLGRVKVGGFTERQFQEYLTRRLSDGYFTDPRVTVAVAEYRSQRIFIIGEVRSPGTYNLTRPTTLVEILALAGSSTANGGAFALVRRRIDGEASKSPVTQAGDGVTEIRVDLTTLQDGALSSNPILHNGDTILVPRAEPVYVFGYVGRPGEYTVGRDTTLRQLLSLAGGVSPRGAAGRIKILRIAGGKQQEIKVELDDRVRPGDTIIVPERYF